MTAAHPSFESLVVDALPAGDRQVLRRGAVLRYITRPLADVVTDTPQAARRLVEHPVVQGRGDQFWTISQPLRKALLSGWEAADEIRARVAEAGSGLEALYARLAAGATRAAALSELAAGFAEALADGDVPRAHDLLRLLDEWPVPDAVEARKLRDRLAPRLRRHSRALRDREATRTYLARGFEDAVWDMLMADDGRWMLHLHAPGGRGKTMFVKNMLGRRCPALDIPVARIDFDHVTQLGIATTEPWRLLVSVAAQLDPQLRDSPFGYLLATYGMFQTVLQPETLPRVAPVTAVPPGGPADELAVDAAREFPERFREQLARAVGDRPVVVALDTVENVLHTEGADLTPVLDAFGDVYHGVAGDADRRVPGLRLILSGRFDLADTGRERSPGFRRRWVGPQSEVERVTPAGTEVLLGREVAAFEVPGFTEEEARRYLAEQGRITDPAMIEAIVGRTHDNPMKLALLAEYVARQPDVTAAAITAFPQVELFYLVDRVVDRIADERVQWLLRWGALLPVLTREAVERVIWPALVAFAESGGGYDDTALDRLPAPTGDIRRWAVPSIAAVREPGALDRSWATLLDYASRSSWVSRMEELPDAVTFHPEVREPLRRLLREGGHPAYDDIHRRSFAYWSAEAESAQGAARTAALRAVLFHAYHPWRGAEHDGDRLFHELLERSAGSRVERAALAREVLEVSVADGPSLEVRSLAHLEVAEAAVALAGRSGSPVPESVLSYQLAEIAEPVRSREHRRIEFLRAVLDETTGQLRDCWARLDGLLDAGTPHAQMELVTTWVATRTPPAYALDTVARMVAATVHTRFRFPAGQALTRGLLAAQRWVDALDAAEEAGSPALRAEALIALGETDAVLADPDVTGDWRARARLLRFEPNAALAELGAGTAPATPAELLLRGRAYAQLDLTTEATGALGEAASGADPVVATEASLELAALLARSDRIAVSTSHLQRLSGYADPVVVMRSRLLAARLESGPRGAQSLAAAESLAGRVPAFPPSLLVDLAVTRLAVHGVTADGLAELRDALVAVQGTGARLLALRALADVPTPAHPAPADPVPPRLRDELRGVTGTAGGLAGRLPPPSWNACSTTTTAPPRSSTGSRPAGTTRTVRWAGRRRTRGTGSRCGARPSRSSTCRWTRRSRCRGASGRCGTTRSRCCWACAPIRSPAASRSSR